MTQFIPHIPSNSASTPNTLYTLTMKNTSVMTRLFNYEYAVILCCLYKECPRIFCVNGFVCRLCEYSAKLKSKNTFIWHHINTRTLCFFIFIYELIYKHSSKRCRFRMVLYFLVDDKLCLYEWHHTLFTTESISNSS